MNITPEFLLACGFAEMSDGSWIKAFEGRPLYIQVSFHPVVVHVAQSELRCVRIEQPTCECVRSAWHALTGQRLDSRASEADAEATLIFSRNHRSHGSLLTQSLCEKHGKAFKMPVMRTYRVDECIAWLDSQAVALRRAVLDYRKTA